METSAPAGGALRSARELYESMCVGGRGDELHAAVASAVADAARVPVLEVLSRADAGATAARSAVAALRSLPQPLHAELRGLPAALGLHALASDVAAAAQDLSSRIAAAAQNPAALYPRLACAPVPVDPARVSSLAKHALKLNARHAEAANQQQQPLSQADVPSPTAASAARAMRGPPKTTTELVVNMAKEFQSIADPLVEGLQKLRDVEKKCADSAESVKALEELADGPLQGLGLAQEKVMQFTEEILNTLFASGEPGSPVSGVHDRDVVLAERGSLPMNVNILDGIEEGTQLLGTASSFQESLGRSMEQARNAGEKLSTLLAELKDMQETGMNLFGNIIRLLRTIMQRLPRVTEEVREFFVPRGLKTLILKPSDDTVALLESIEKLKTAIADPEDIRTRAASVFQDSESVAKVSIIKGTFIDIQDSPRELKSQLATMSNDLPDVISKSVLQALQDWASNSGHDALEGFIGDTAKRIGGQHLEHAVADLLSFKDTKDAGRGKTLTTAANHHEDDSMLSGIATAAGGILNSIF